jgi:hypothetical protein
MSKKYTMDSKAVEIVISHSKYQTVDIENHYSKHTHNLELIRDISIKMNP